MNKMKKILYYTVIIGAFILASCEDAIYKDPLAQQSYIDFFSKDANLESAIAGCYDPLGWEDTYARSLCYTWDAMGGDSEIAGDGPNDQESAQQLMLYRKNLSSNAVSSGLWSAHYKGISRCNTVIEEVSARINDYENPDLARRIVAEAKFLKAFYYFDLTKAFGPVILLKETPNPKDLVNYGNRVDDVDDGSKQIAEQWKHIEELLVEAIDDLPTKKEMNDGHATKEAAQSLLAKKYVFNEEWDKAEPQVDAVINSFDIAEWKSVKYQEMFQAKEAGNNGPQSIFEVQYVIGSGYDRKGEGATRSRDQSVRVVKVDGKNEETADWGINGPVKEYVELFENAIHDIGDYDYDPRADLIAKPGDSIIFNEVWVPISFDHPIYHKTGFVNRKGEYQADETIKERSNSGLNYPLIRFADVLLWKAEISAELGKLDVALEYVNLVRERARLSKRVPNGNGGYKYEVGTIPADYTSSDFSSKEDALELIYKERRLELGMEGHTFHDIVRTGRAEKIFSKRGLDSHNRAFTWTTGVNEVIPIPAVQIEMHKGNLKQNNGYY